jgi:hypothetical protein
MIRVDEPWLGRNLLSQSLVEAAAAVAAPVNSFQTTKAVAHHLSVVGHRQQMPTGPKQRRDTAERHCHPEESEGQTTT